MAILLLEKYKNNPLKNRCSFRYCLLFRGIFLGKIITNDNGTGVDLQIFPNIQMSYFSSKIT